MVKLASFFFLMFALALIVVPDLFYKKRSAVMAKFCVRMSMNEHAQMLYSFLLELAMLLFNYSFGTAFAQDWGVMLGVFPIVFFFLPKRTIPFLRRLRANRKMMVALFTATLVVAFIPHLLPLAVMAAFVIIAACFFPSPTVEGKLPLLYLDKDTEFTAEDVDDLMQDYFN